MKTSIPEEPISILKTMQAPYILDVRTQQEWNEGHLDNAHHIELQSLGQKFGTLPRGQRIYVMCRSGGRSATATALLIEQGFDAVNMAGGILAWKQ